jgi:YfiH family protein
MLVPRTNDGITVFTDNALRSSHGMLVAFTCRTGGCSSPPYASLNLAGHVGDAPGAVDANRTALLASLGIERLRQRLTTAEQVHGVRIAAVTADTAGAGAFVADRSSGPEPAADGLLTAEPEVPLLMCYADCVPVVLVTTGPRRAVAIVHAGWRGALAGIAAKGVLALTAASGCPAAGVTAYIGPHIGPCHYEVGEALLSQFVYTFGTIAAAQGRLDLGAVVSENLNGVGVPPSSQCRVGLCTAERTDAFFSYRAEGLTGRHGAVACILGDNE